MRCPRCQHDNPPRMKFCGECAAPLAARCHLGLGMLYGATSHPESAQHHLATAATMFRDMAMRSWLEKTQAEMDEGSRDTA